MFVWYLLVSQDLFDMKFSSYLHIAWHFKYFILISTFTCYKLLGVMYTPESIDLI